MPTDVIVLLIYVFLKVKSLLSKTNVTLEDFAELDNLLAKSLLSKTNVTLEDFAELDNLLAKSGESYFEKK